jgi:hypothetical protein
MFVSPSFLKKFGETNGITLFEIIERYPGFIGTGKTGIRKQKAGPIRPCLSAIKPFMYVFGYFLNFLLIPATPNRPRPRSNKVAGSGTEVGATDSTITTKS